MGLARWTQTWNEYCENHLFVGCCSLNVRASQGTCKTSCPLDRVAKFVLGCFCLLVEDACSLCLCLFATQSFFAVIDMDLCCLFARNRDTWRFSSLCVVKLGFKNKKQRVFVKRKVGRMLSSHFESVVLRRIAGGGAAAQRLLAGVSLLVGCCQLLLLLLLLRACTLHS